MLKRYFYFLIVRGGPLEITGRGGGGEQFPPKKIPAKENCKKRKKKKFLQAVHPASKLSQSMKSKHNFK